MSLVQFQRHGGNKVISSLEQEVNSSKARIQRQLELTRKVQELDDLRQIVDENMDANFLLTSGNRVMIKRKRFEECLNAAPVI